MRVSQGRWLVLFSLTGAALWAACGSDNAGGSSKRSCDDDTECRPDQVCEDNRCVAFEGSGGSGSGTGSAATTGASTGSGVTPGDQSLCEDYLTCLATANPDALPQALAAYGPDGDCWQGGADVQAACGTACFESMKSLHTYDPVACHACYVDADCGDGATCDAGSCVYEALTLPNATAECDACVTTDGASVCEGYLQSCAQNPECIAAATCIAGCADGDYACYDSCNAFSTGYFDYVNCVCNACYELCQSSGVCGAIG